MKNIQTVLCPICAASIPESSINSHLDSGCSAASPKRKNVADHESSNNRRVSSIQAIRTGKSETQDIQSTVFSPGSIKIPVNNIKLAELARPVSWDDFKGSFPTAQGAMLKSLSDHGHPPSFILCGPPGCGKTTLARLIAKQQGGYFQEFSASTDNSDTLKKAGEAAKRHFKLTKQKCTIFLDEIHRFTKSQQDIFLGPIERGDYLFIAATTENPSFRINSALLSRCRIFMLDKLSEEAMLQVLERAAGLRNACWNTFILTDQLRFIANACDGDARTALNCLDMVMETCNINQTPITNRDITLVLQKPQMSYDRNGDNHYDTISALIKSMRGSDDNAAMYWLGRMLYSGEDPVFIARRLVIFASEDVGIADSGALSLAMSAMQACQCIGMPECDIILAHVVTYMARAKKSVETYKAIRNVKECLEKYPVASVPLHLRNAPTKIMKDMGYGRDYKYPPLFEENPEQSYLPEDFPIKSFFIKS